MKSSVHGLNSTMEDTEEWVGELEDRDYPIWVIEKK